MQTAVTCLVLAAAVAQPLAAQEPELEGWDFLGRAQDPRPAVQVELPDAPYGVSLVVRAQVCLTGAWPRPALWLVGGEAHRWRSVDQELARWGAQHGLTVLTCGWEGLRADEVPAPGPAETAAALRTVVERRHALGIDAERIAAVAIGLDAGDELLRWLGTEPAPSFRAVVLLDPVDGERPQREVAIVPRPPAMLAWRAPRPAGPAPLQARDAQALQQLAALAGRWMASGTAVELHVMPTPGTLVTEAPAVGSTGRLTELMAEFLTLHGALTAVPRVAAADRDILRQVRGEGADDPWFSLDSSRMTGWLLAVDDDGGCDLVIDWAASPVTPGSWLGAYEDGRCVGLIEIVSTSGVRARGKVTNRTGDGELRPGMVLAGG